MSLTFVCAFCSKEKTVTKWVNRVKKRYCSRKCYGQARSKGTYKPWNKGTKGKQTAWNKGLVLADHPRLARKRGKESPNWKGGQESKRDIIKNRSEYAQLRHIVFGRDNFTCQICKKRSKKGNRREIHMHHLKPYRTHPHLFLKSFNCQTVCTDCHKSIHSKQPSSNRAK